MSDVLISESEYNELIEDQKFLRALQAAGVDNWEGICVAIDILDEWNKEED